MWPDRVSNPVPLALESDALLTARLTQELEVPGTDRHTIILYVSSQ